MILHFLLLCALAGTLSGIILGVYLTPPRKILAVALILAASAGGLVGATAISSEKTSKSDISSKTSPDMASPCPERSEEVVLPDDKTTLQMWLARHPEEEGG